jgi:Outer membrane protein beta-barrel domain
MKKLILLLFFFVSSFSFAQPDSTRKVYIGINAGYGFGAFRDELGKINTGDPAGDKSVYCSYGKGFKYSLNLGYYFKPWFSIELGITYKKGLSDSVKKNWSSGDVHFHSISNSKNIKWTSSPQLFLFPSARINLGHKTNPYLKCGVSVGLMNKLIKDSLFITDDPYASTSIIFHQTTEYSKGYNIGVVGAIGLEHFFTKRWMFFFEFDLNYMTWKPQNVDMTLVEPSTTSQTNNNSVPIYENQKRAFSSWDINTGFRVLF